MGVQFPEKKRYVTLEWPLCGEVCQYTIGMETMFASVESSLNCRPVTSSVDAMSRKCYSCFFTNNNCW